MVTPMRIATFNLENLDDKPEPPTLAERITVLRPQLLRLRANILALQEVNGQGQPITTLLALDQLRAQTPYANFNVAHTKTAAGDAFVERNLVVLSEFPILEAKQFKHDRAPAPQYRRITAKPPDQQAKDITWERPILYTKIDLGGSRTLHLLNLHLKSRNPSDVPGQKEDTYVWKSASGWAEGYFISSVRRVGQALEARILIDEIFDAEEDALILVCGDLNADFDEVPVKTIRGLVEDTGNPALIRRVMVPCELSVPESSRYSFLYLGKGSMLDHILCSRALVPFYRGTEIHNEVLPDESGAFRTDVKFPESDHAPVVAEFVLP